MWQVSLSNIRKKSEKYGSEVNVLKNKLAGKLDLRTSRFTRHWTVGKNGLRANKFRKGGIVRKRM